MNVVLELNIIVETRVSCMLVCKFSQISNEKEFYPRKEIKKRNIEDWDKITEDDFRVIFKKSPIKRTKYSGLKRNIETVLNKK